MTRKYNHYCPVAFSLEVIGGKWSFTIIRDLLTRPQRFSDLLQYSSNVTPKGLTLALRQLEETGIVEREEQPGHREVWYRLTRAGQDLRPVVEAMKEWGLKHAMRPPLPGEVVRPDLAMDVITDSLNKRGRKLPQPTTWLMCFTHGGAHVLSFDGDRWSTSKGEQADPDVRVTVSPEAWATFLAVKRSERDQYVQSLQLDGSPERVEEFLRAFVVRDTLY
ncbi:winged helix-turn-helix transcriptional regulator [Desulfosporosinus nitroreducens]|uniref:Helix-turn-helix transcriptional regulator n=1 Tax=Desulfosporosinus nitroreducens TaxID=2018668 RepID=A0ABT8QSF9_9FIRM|nr:helix-turn-helix domain-containing protein [Desulfosporosinus nitroreducens]MCO1603710.1 helix-turn-helix transcriptional regulator [Desulfosporosinus nitroreducens]MDO0824271.1 helix-turn-helix transcriptional regulator [Desulfosporosinus nitroreducens]